MFGSGFHFIPIPLMEEHDMVYVELDYRVGALGKPNRIFGPTLGGRRPDFISGRPRGFKPYNPSNTVRYYLTATEKQPTLVILIGNISNQIF